MSWVSRSIVNTNIGSVVPTRALGFIRTGVLVFPLEIMLYFHSSDNYVLWRKSLHFRLWIFLYVICLRFGTWENQERAELDVNCDI